MPVSLFCQNQHAAFWGGDKAVHVDQPALSVTTQRNKSPSLFSPICNFSFSGHWSQDYRECRMQRAVDLLFLRGFSPTLDDVDCAYLWEYLDINENREEALPAPQVNPDISGIGVSGIFDQD